VVTCGAVKAAVGVKGKLEGNIGAILKKIMPAVKVAKKAKKGDEETLELAIQENVRNTYNDIMKSPVVRHLANEGKLKIVATEYQLKDGKVETIDLNPAAAQHHKH
jgi:carbonic anhydrase